MAGMSTLSPGASLHPSQRREVGDVGAGGRAESQHPTSGHLTAMAPEQAAAQGSRGSQAGTHHTLLALV